MGCQIVYNDNNTYTINAPNGKESILFSKIKELPEITSDYEAMRSWLKIYTKSFKEWYGKDWENLSEAETKQLIKDGYLDQNGEPNIFYRGDYAGIESFNYSNAVGKFGQGIYLAQNLMQAEEFAKKTGKTVFPVFLRPSKSVNFRNVTEFVKAVAEFNDVKTVPTQQQTASYVDSLHGNQTNIIGTGVMGREYNVHNKEEVKSIFTKGFEISSGMLFDNTSTASQFMTEDFQEKRKSDQFVSELADRLSKNLKVPYEMISKDKALLITKDAPNPWNGQPAFEYKGVVYFVNGQLTYKTAIHEFAHPFITAISKDNPGLFNKIFEEALATDEGAQFLAEALEEYPDLDATHDQIKKEVLVKAMTYVAQNSNKIDKAIQPSGGLMAIIKKLLYALKQALRKITGKTNLKNLAVDTNLEELTHMLIDDTWNIDLGILSEEDMVSYMHEVSEHLEDLNKFNKSDEGRAAIHRILLENADLAMKQMREMKDSADYESLKIVLADVTGNEDFQQMLKNMRALNTQAKVDRAYDQRIDEIQEFKRRVEALSFNLTVMNDSVERMKKHIANLADSPDQKYALSQVTFYTKSMSEWDLFLKRFLEAAEDPQYGINVETPLINDIRDIREKIRRGKQDVQTIYKNATRDVLFEMWEPMNEAVRETTDKEIAKVRKKMEKKAPGSKLYQQGEKEIADLEAKRDEALVSKEKLLDYITGQMGDIGGLHAWLESFTANQDPSIASFGLFIKTHLSEVQTKTHQKYNEFVTKLDPLLKELGVNPSKINKFSELFLFKDKSYRREGDKLIEFDVYTFLNEFKGYKWQMAAMNDRINRAELEFESNRNDENTKAFVEAVTDKSNHTKLFFHNIYMDEYYHADDILDKSLIGRKAKLKKESIMSKIEFYQREHSDDQQLYEDYETVEGYWREYKQLYSLYDEYGKLKTGDEKAMAEVLREHRDAKRKFYEYNEIAGAFQTSYKQFAVKEEIRLKEEFGEDKDGLEQELSFRKQMWLERNTQIKVKDEFYQARDRILGRIREIMDSIKTDVKFDVEWQTILDSLQGRRDQNGQPVGTEMTNELLGTIKDIEQKMYDAKQEIAGISGLTPKEQGVMHKFYSKMDAGDKLTADELKTYNKLRAKGKELGLSKPVRDELFGLFRALEALQKRVPTDYYIDVVQNYYRDIEEAERKGTDLEGTAYTVINNANIKKFSEPAFIAPLLQKSEAFKTWFHDNHILKEKFDADLGERVQKYERIYAWSVVKPNDKKYLETTDILDEEGNVTETITGVPNIKYFRRDVKQKYHTGYNPTTKKVELITGVHKNAQGRWLPKSLEEMEKVRTKYSKQMTAQPFAYDHYINHDYAKLRRSNPAAFKVLETLKEFHLEGQMGLEANGKLGLELPRFRRDLYEYAVSGELGKDTKDTWGRLFEGFLQLWAKRKDDREDGLNDEEQNRVNDLDLWSGENGKVPIRGKYLLEPDQVSRDITGSLMMYYQSSEANKKLREIQPIARALQSLAGERNPNEIKGLSKKAAREAHGYDFIEGNTNNRKKVIDSMVEIMFEGKNLFAGSNKSGVGIKVINNMLGLASHSFFAFDITSALKNHIGAQFQIALEGAGGKYFNYVDWQQGRWWAEKAMWQVSGQVYKTTAKTLDVQLIQIFDAIQGDFESKFGESLSRSFARDAANLSWTTSHRKWLETEATLQLFSAIMGTTRVEQTIDGTTKKIRYRDAWELDPETKSIRLKEGIDKSWDIDGKNFNKIKFRNHEVSNLLQGAYAAFDQPMVNRHILWRLVSSMRKFFTKMFLHRYGMRSGTWYDPRTYSERYNLPTQDMHMGFYMRNLATMAKLIQSRGKHLHYMTKDEWRAFRMGFLELFKLMLLTASYMWIWGYDPDDPDRWKKLQGKMASPDRMSWLVGEGSGALPHPMVDEEWTENFNLKGWLGNQVLLLAMHVEAENEHFIPWPGFGMKDMSTVISETSVASGPSIDAFITLFHDLIFTIEGDDSVYYKKDVGALNIQQEGAWKFWKHLYKMGGIKGKFMDPVTSIKNFQGMRENYAR